MIQTDRMRGIGAKLEAAVGFREDVGDFVFKFAALPIGHDLEYALEELRGDHDPEYKTAIKIVLEGLT